MPTSFGLVQKAAEFPQWTLKTIALKILIIC
jgi:hypothetical protein